MGLAMRYLPRPAVAPPMMRTARVAGQGPVTTP